MDEPRRFRAYCVGLPKTGTTSVGTIFEHYRSAKIAGSGQERLADDLRAGKLPHASVRELVRRRADEAELELDASSSNWTVLDALVDEFPDAKFILTIRDCYSWCDSILNVVIGREIGHDFLEDPKLFRSYLGCDLEWFADADTVVGLGRTVLDPLLRFWSQQAALVARAPSSRTLILRTGEISASLDRMADFVGVPRETLFAERSHSRKTERKFHILQKLDRGLLESAFAAHAGSDLMRELFPSATLGEFLARRVAAAPAAAAPIAKGPSSERPKPPADPLAGAAGRREITEAVEAIRERCVEEVPRRFGHRLERHSVRADGGTCFGLVELANGERRLLLEIALRAPNTPYWLSSERFTVSYRRDTPPVGQGDQQLAKMLLDAVEQRVRTPSDGETDEPER